MRTPKEWFEATVHPVFQDYVSGPTLEYKADAALCVIAHFDETVFAYLKHCDPKWLPGGKSKYEFRKVLDKKCPALKILRDSADARKHGELDRNTENRSLRFATDVSQDDGGVWMIRGNINRPLLEVLQCAVSFWERWIKEHPTE